MGNTFTNLYNSLFNKMKEARVLMLGLDAAGKTTITRQLKYGEPGNTMPTIGFGVETVEFQNVKMTLWDIGGQTKIRELWKHYFHGTDTLIFVVDSSDKDRLKLARDELHLVLNREELINVDLLVWANKQDMGVLSVEDVIKGLDLRSLVGRNWYCQGCSALTGSGLSEGLEWISNQFGKKKA